MRNHAQIRTAELRVRLEVVQEIRDFAKVLGTKYQRDVELATQEGLQVAIQRREGASSAVTALSALVRRWEDEISRLEKKG